MLLLLLAAVMTLPAQGTDPKPKASDYPVHLQVGDLSIGAEYMVHSVSGPQASFIAEDYLVVEVALYPPRSGTMVRAREWTLRLNGKKEELLAQTPGMVAQSIKYGDLNRRGRIVVGAGPIILGQPRPVDRFPGDPTTRVPGSSQSEEPLDLTDVIRRLALLEGNINRPISGYLFFAWQGKTSKIKSLSLIWRPEAGEPAVFTLR